MALSAEGPSRGFGLSLGLVGLAGGLAAMAGWVYSYREWHRKNRAGQLASEQTAAEQLGDLARYAVLGRLEPAGQCPGCRGHLTGSGPFAVADGRLWRPEHAHCHRCREDEEPEPGGQRIAADGSLWCARHWPEWADAYNCSLCGDQLPETPVVQPDGKLLCQRHAHAPRCYSCHARLRDGPSPGATGVLLCSECRSSSVWGLEAARALFSQVAEELAADLGVDVGLGEIELQVGDMEHGVAQYKANGGMGEVCVEGLTKMKHFEVQVGAKRVVHREVDGIFVMQGLPRLHTAQVLAHELMHAWLAKHKTICSSREVEEGLCELASYLWLAELADRLRGRAEPVPRTARSAYQGQQDEHSLTQVLTRLRLMEAGAKAGVYADGFAAALTALQGRSLPQLLAHVKKTGQLPPAEYPCPLVGFEGQATGSTPTPMPPPTTVYATPDFRGA